MGVGVLRQPPVLTVSQLFRVGYNQNVNQSRSFNTEADLDFQYGIGLTYPTSVSLLEVGEGAKTAMDTIH